MRKIWDTPGGVHPPDNKAQSLTQPLHELPLPPEIVLPVSQHIGEPAEPVVAVGDTVRKGQLIAAAAGVFSANLHASTSGTVTVIENHPLAHPSGLDGLCIVIKPDGQDQWADLEDCRDYRQLEPATLVDRIQAAGVVGMGGAGFPTSTKLNSPLKIDTLIINGTECEPYITADDMLMQTQAEEIIRGIELLDYLLQGPGRILIGIENNKPNAIAAMKNAVQAMHDSRVDVVPLPVKYPSGGERQLVQMLTGKEVESGRLPAHLGIICQNVATVVAAYRAVRFGEPLIARITTVTGQAFSIQRNVRVRFGTPINFVLQQHGYDTKKASRLVMGGPMMGFTLLDTHAPVIKTTNCLLAPTAEESPPPLPAQACIRCGMCAEACPASLLPQQLYWYARAEDEEKLRAHNLFDCIECGACSYVCPSHIPLVQYYRAAKGQIKQHNFEKQHADRARQRFEFHKQRVEQEQVERARAREEAARKAKQRQAQKAVAQNVPTETPAPGNATKPSEPEQARLSRNLQAQEERLKKLHDKLAELEKQSPEQASAVQARIKEAELKQKTLRDKLAALNNL